MTTMIDMTAAPGVRVATTRSGTVFAIDTAAWRVWCTPGTVVVSAPMGLIHHNLGGARMHMSATVESVRPATLDDLAQYAPRLPARAVPTANPAARERS